MGLGEIDLVPVLFEGANGDNHFWFLLENLEKEEEFGGYLPLLGCDFEVVNPLLLAPVLDTFTGCHPSTLIPISSYSSDSNSNKA